jgi:hypothetical protein
MARQLGATSLNNKRENPKQLNRDVIAPDGGQMAAKWRPNGGQMAQSLIV